jgi:hypothetical protein
VLEPTINRADEALKRTLEMWSKRSTRPLSNEDARQIEENAIGFFRVLIEWKVRKVEASLCCLTIQKQFLKASKIAIDR